MLISQKAQEISLALIKVSVSSRRIEFRHRIERLAFGLLEDAGASRFEGALEKLSSLETLVRFGKTIYEIEPVNAKILIDEFGNMANTIRQIAGLEINPDLGFIFSDSGAIEKKNEILPKPKKLDISINPPGNAQNIKTKKEPVIKEAKSIIGGEWGNAAIRQSAIVEKIRQSGNDQFQLKDFISEFKGVSERTIRYDLQKLCGQGVLERIGSGGPSTYYKIRTL